MVLFMVLPHAAAAPAKPGLGHAPSAPEKPQLRRKFRWATLAAVLPTIGIYFIATYAKAEDMYHAGGGCEPLSAYQAPADISTRDGYGAGEKKVKPADLEGGTVLGNMDKIAIPLAIPTAKYLEPDPSNPTHNVDLSQSFARMGTIEVGKDGDALLNGQPIGGQAVLPAGCEHSTK